MSTHRISVKIGAIVTAIGGIITLGAIIWIAVILRYAGTVTGALATLDYLYATYSMFIGLAVAFLGVAVGLWGLARGEPGGPQGN